MPRDLFGDVTHPSVSVGTRKWYTVPLSLLTHSVVIAVVIVLPLVAAPLLPHVLDSSTGVVVLTMAPPPPPPPPRMLDTVEPIANPNAAPTVAPDTIGEERDVMPVEHGVPDSIIVGDPAGVDHALAPPPPQVEATPPKPVRAGAGVRTPVKVHHVDPVYPLMAQRALIKGIVIIEATIAEDGRVTNTRVLRSIPLLDQAALDAVQQWQFTPTLLNGVPTPVIMTVTVHFTLSR